MSRALPPRRFHCLALVAAFAGLFSAYAFDPLSDTNLVNYWGQNSFGATGGDMQLWQKPLTDYCQASEAEDVIVLAFLHVFNGASRQLPRMDLSNQCDPSSVFPGTSLLHCSQTGYGVKQCQSKGKAVLLSLGGAAGAYGFSNEAEAKDFAHMIWNLFLGGSSKTRPLDDAVLDGVDLDIEGGSSIGYTAFIQELRLLFAGDTRKQYYISAAPQCPFPDAYLGATLQSAWLDMVFVQFYNNYCGTQAYGTFNFNFDQWDEWAKSTSINKDVRIYLGVPASRTAANAGYVTAEKLGKIADELRCAYSSFGGIMMWDTSQAYGNFESAGVQYSVAAARNLKRPRNVVCGDDQGPAGEPRTQEPPAQLSPIATLTDLTTSTTAILTTTAVTATSAASASPSIAPIGPPRAPDTSVPRPEPQQHGTLCPIEGGKCQPSTSTDLVCDGYNFAICNFGHWILRSCAPGTYCTPHGCDFIQGPVKTCRELEQEASTARIMGQQMQQSVNGAMTSFGAALADFLGMDRGGDDKHSDDRHDEPAVSRPAGFQHAFVAPGPVGNMGHNESSSDETDLDYQAQEPFLIDFCQLDTDAEVFVHAENGDIRIIEPFRTQVRIRTNDESISRVWNVSFLVQPGQVVQNTSRGSLQQNGLWVTVKSDPTKEVDQSMVVRFVVQGTRTRSTVRGFDEMQQNYKQDMLEAASLPDPSLAQFQTDRNTPHHRQLD